MKFSKKKRNFGNLGIFKKNEILEIWKISKKNSLRLNPYPPPRGRGGRRSHVLKLYHRKSHVLKPYGVTRLLDLVGLSLGFWVIRKWIAVNVVSEWEQSVQGPSLDHGFCVFYGKIEKTVFLQIRPGTAPLGKFCSNWRFLTLWQLAASGCGRMERSASRPCRARCI